LLSVLSRVGSRFSLAAGAAIVLLSLGATPASALGDYAATAQGYDISWPQCGRPVEITQDSFGLVGVNGGTPYTMNPCFAGQYHWATAGGATPGIYMNLQGGEAATGYQSCPDSDIGCRAYNYGYNAAEYAFGHAYQETGGASLGANTWWLDVEAANDWRDQGANAAVVRGAVDYLRHIAGQKVGIYSTSRQYSTIKGGLYAPAGVGNWVAGADGVGANDMCGRAFWPGAQVWFFQYTNLDIDLDQDVAC